jgi:hypothetical protein
MVGYNVQTAVDAEHHLIAAHEVTNEGSDRGMLSMRAIKARTEMGVKELEVVADRGYYKGQEIKICDDAGMTVYIPKSRTSNNRVRGLYDKQDFRDLPESD